MGDARPRGRGSPAGIDSLRLAGQDAFGHLEDASGRIQVYFRRDELGAAVRPGRAARSGRPHRGAGDAVPDQDGRDHRPGRAASRCWPSPCGRCRGGRPRQTESGAVTLRRPAGSRGALPPALRRPGGASRGARRSSGSAPRRSPGSAAFWTTGAFSRWRRRSSSRSTAARRRGRSSPTTTRWTCRSTSGSPTSCTSSGCWWAGSSGCTRSATTSGTREWTGPTIPSSPCWRSTRPTPTTAT